MYESLSGDWGNYRAINYTRLHNDACRRGQGARNSSEFARARTRLVSFSLCCRVYLSRKENEKKRNCLLICFTKNSIRTLVTFFVSSSILVFAETLCVYIKYE